MRKAIVDGVVRNLMDEGDDIWESLRRERPRIVCVGCGGPAHTRETRIDRLVVRTFAHNPGQAERCRLFGGVESAEHEVLKESIVRSARSSGWTADIEVISRDERVRADVVCTKGSRTHSWEAQLAVLSRADANDRHEKYVNEWSNTTWVHTRRRDWSKDIPCLRVDEETRRKVVGGVYVDELAEERIAPTLLTSFVPRVLDNDRIQYLLEPFGFYRDLRVAPTAKVSRRHRGSDREGVVYSTTDCPTEEPVVDLFGDVVSEAVRVRKTVDDKRWWEQRARLAAAKQLDGVTLDETDIEALRRRWIPDV
jgi:hypothetical protein